ncbi:cytosolic 5'-nucleotidase 1A-like isoform X1 [Echeneis naucrates]|uniref:Cytosolic 5'-nucleotidase 1A-like n=1 Tax=Echeneis naucrates TaxID=173247 RepID=A0A665W562_ECHNA|nr:cytosolic 5'-nucleotidase 1A-like isoform X1 [Echeneis naucrates]
MSLSEQEMPIVVAMSSKILFDSELNCGPAFSFVMALKAVNVRLRELYPESEELFKVLLDGNAVEMIQEYNLEDLITPLAVSEDQRLGELQRKNTHLYLSAPPGSQLQEAMELGIAAAVMYNPKNIMDLTETPLRVVFDGDGVLFSHQSLKKRGLQGFLDHEREKVNEPLPDGPFKNFLAALIKLQKKCDKIIMTYLVTARNAGNAGYRALNTLKTWGLEIDQAYFLEGAPKPPVLKMIQPHIYIDDSISHVQGALKEGVVACHVKY